MYVKNVKYEDYNGEEKEEVLRFHMNKPEVLDWALQDGNASLEQVIMRIIEKRNTKDMMKAFEDLIDRSYGEKTTDGRFEKDEDILKRFKSSAAYPEFFMLIASDADEAVKFLKGIMPSDISDAIEEATQNGAAGLPDNIRELLPKA